VNALRATFAIARREMRPYWLYSVGARILLGAALGTLDTFRFGQGLIVMMILAVPLGVVAGLEPRIRDLTYFIAPLYGRQLARAYAVTAATAAFALPCAFLVANILSVRVLADSAIYHDIGFSWTSIDQSRGAPLQVPTEWLVAGVALAMTVASVIASLVGLSATLRRGLARTAYVALACLSGYFSFLIIAATAFDVPFLLGAFAAALLLGFLALRAFGETLARYDPVPY